MKKILLFLLPLLLLSSCASYFNKTIQQVVFSGDKGFVQDKDGSYFVISLDGKKSIPTEIIFTAKFIPKDLKTNEQAIFETDKPDYINIETLNKTQVKVTAIKYTEDVITITAYTETIPGSSYPIYIK